MSTPPISKVSIQTVENQSAILLICDDSSAAQKLDIMMDGCSIAWYIDASNQLKITIKSDAIGIYSFNVNNDLITPIKLESCKFIVIAFRLESGGLDYIHPPRLIKH